MSNNSFKIVYSVIVGAIGAVIFITAITITADLYLPLKNWLADTFFHHWLGKGILSIVVFIIISLLGWFLSKEANENKINKFLKLLSWLLILGSLAIIGFFIWEAFLK